MNKNINITELCQIDPMIDSDYELDLELSTKDNIVLKRIDPKTRYPKDMKNISRSSTNTASGSFRYPAQSRAVSALADITLLVAEYNKGTVLDWNDNSYYHVAIRADSSLYVPENTTRYPTLLAFLSKEAAVHFLNYHADKIKEAAPLLWGVTISNDSQERAYIIY